MLDSEGFDLWADDYDQSVGLSDENGSYPFAGYKQVLNTIYQEIIKRPRPDVLDLGFGTGTLTAKLYEKGCRIRGIDFSPRMTDLARSKMPEAEFICWDFGRGVPEIFRDRRYDFIIATYSLHHLTDPAKITLIHSLTGLLKPKGRVLLGDIAFKDRAALERCRSLSGSEWDDEEIYPVYEEMVPYFGEQVQFQEISFCAAVLSFEGQEPRHEEVS